MSLNSATAVTPNSNAAAVAEVASNSVPETATLVEISKVLVKASEVLRDPNGPKTPAYQEFAVRVALFAFSAALLLPGVGGTAVKNHSTTSVTTTYQIQNLNPSSHLSNFFQSENVRWEEFSAVLRDILVQFSLPECSASEIPFLTQCQGTLRRALTGKIEDDINRIFPVGFARLSKSMIGDMTEVPTVSNLEKIFSCPLSAARFFGLQMTSMSSYLGEKT